MIIKQVSVSIEDRVGSSWQVFQTLADNRINILSYSIEDTPPQGTLRLIVDDATKADEVLRNVGFRTQLTNVYSMNVPNHIGSMSRVLKYLTEKEVSIDFMYVFQYMGFLPISRKMIIFAPTNYTHSPFLWVEEVAK